MAAWYFCDKMLSRSWMRNSSVLFFFLLLLCCQLRKGPRDRHCRRRQLICVCVCFFGFLFFVFSFKIVTFFSAASIWTIYSYNFFFFITNRDFQMAIERNKTNKKKKKQHLYYEIHKTQGHKSTTRKIKVRYRCVVGNVCFG